MKPVDLFVVDKYVMSQGFEKKKGREESPSSLFFFFLTTQVRKTERKKKWVSVETNTNLTTNQLNN